MKEEEWEEKRGKERKERKILDPSFTSPLSREIRVEGKLFSLSSSWFASLPTKLAHHPAVETPQPHWAPRLPVEPLRPTAQPPCRYSVELVPSAQFWMDAIWGQIAFVESQTDVIWSQITSTGLVITCFVQKFC